MNLSDTVCLGEVPAAIITWSQLSVYDEEFSSGPSYPWPIRSWRGFKLTAKG
jgi:hypothetical protein